MNKCECFGQWTGGDCSLRKCPIGNAWTDIATAEDVAHAEVECSNRGTCDHSSGECKCMPGFEGLACNRMSCPDECNGVGLCNSMRENALAADRGFVPLPGAPVKNNRVVFSYSQPWDADMIHGCTCDTGYGSWDCSERKCPVGDDPLTTTATPVNEIQLLSCSLTPATYPNAIFTLSFGNALTQPFKADIGPVALETLLEALPTVGDVTVTYSAGSEFCNPALNIVSIEFLEQAGSNLPRIMVLDEKGNYLQTVVDNAVTTAAKGETIGGVGGITSNAAEREALPCSGRGKCNARTGVCACFTGFTSSNGKGSQGNIGDCGFAYLPITSCPGAALECSGHGTCSGSPTYKCTCYDGWRGGDCSEATCPLGKAWFDTPSSKDVAHALAECSNRGKCNRVSGACECQTMFEGEACDRMTCPGSKAGGGTCSGHGRCLSMTQLAANARPNGDPDPQLYGRNPGNTAAWDGRSSYGCLCDTGYTGYDCSERVCPKGNDVTLTEWDPKVLDEEQELSCQVLPTLPAAGVTFRLSFRGAVTRPIATSATVAQVKAALEELPTIDTINVVLRRQDGDTNPGSGTPAAVNRGVIETDLALPVCWNGGANDETAERFMTFQFKTEHGDLPPIRVVMDESTRNLVTGEYSQAVTSSGWTRDEITWGAGNPSTGFTSLLYYDKTPRTPGGNEAPAVNLSPGGSVYPSTGVRAREWRKGSTIDEECADRGICDRDTGVCKCFIGFGQAQYAQAGLVDNCAAREPYSFPKALRAGNVRY